MLLLGITVLLLGGYLVYALAHPELTEQMNTV